jgi:hypothetical protein
MEAIGRRSGQAPGDFAGEQDMVINMSIRGSQAEIAAPTLRVSAMLERSARCMARCWQFGFELSHRCLSASERGEG